MNLNLNKFPIILYLEKEFEFKIQPHRVMSSNEGLHVVFMKVLS